jgi:hypothetical protein
MERRTFFLMMIPCFLCLSVCFSQITTSLSNPEVELIGNELHITYYILNGSPEEKYIISLDVRDSIGNPIEVRSINGDIGEVQDGGGTKEIVWNLGADNIFINEYIEVRISARVKPLADLPVEESDKKRIDEDAEPFVAAEPPSSLKSKSYNRTAIVLQSVALPGLGLSRVTGSPHWLRGVAGYGCLAGSVILNRLSVKNLENAEGTFEYQVAQDAFDRSVRQDQASEILAYTALGIWITDIIWTLVGTTDLKGATGHMGERGFSLRTSINDQYRVPMLSLSYKF